MTRIAFIGLGNMGGPMAANLVKAGHAVAGFDLAPASLDAARQAGVAVAASAREAAAEAEVVVTMLPAGRHVVSVWSDLLDAVRPGTLLVDSSTIDVDSARRAHALAEARGCASLDAPVSGGVGGASAGTLTFMCGGAEAAFSRAEPVLSRMGRKVVHCGGAGAGQAAKICNNMMLAITMIGVSEGFLLAQRLGLDWDKLWAITSTATAQSWALSSYCPAPGVVPTAPSNRDYAPGFMAALMLKDVNLSQAAAEATGTPTPLGAHAAALYRQLVDAGEGARDFSVIFRWLDGQARAPADG